MLAPSDASRASTCRLVAPSRSMSRWSEWGSHRSMVPAWGSFDRTGRTHKFEVDTSCRRRTRPEVWQVQAGAV